MLTKEVDVLIVGAGPVGLMCAYLGNLCGLSVLAVDKSVGPLQVGRADALNARTLQLLELADLFHEIYPMGKTCNTSSIWKDRKFVSRQSSWWDELEGCFHKHFLMLGQAHIEQTIDAKLRTLGIPVLRSTSVKDIKQSGSGCETLLSDGTTIHSKFLIAADGSRSFVREHFNIPFDILRPQIIWAVVDGVIETDFKKVPEIIVFQTETSDVAWIPREGDIDRFYIRMDKKDFSFNEVLEKINNAIKPHTLNFKEIVWYSQFSVKESVAAHFSIDNKIFLAGDAGHIHSVNGGQGLNTGLADAFNIIWKCHMVLNHQLPPRLLSSYEAERKPVAESVIESSGELVRATKYSEQGTHAQDYINIVQKRSGNITGMGIRYGKDGLDGTRLFDFEVSCGDANQRIYSLLSYTHYTLLIFGDALLPLDLPQFVKSIQILPKNTDGKFWAQNSCYANQAVLVRPDSYIEFCRPLEDVKDSLMNFLNEIKSQD